uniref:Uncharacterized protein n=1 Tax=Anguilla anguilla TaxID=7936 RepID=A0A0E9PJL6_ANGAN
MANILGFIATANRCWGQLNSGTFGSRCSEDRLLLGTQTG